MKFDAFLKVSGSVVALGLCVFVVAGGGRSWSIRRPSITSPMKLRVKVLGCISSFLLRMCFEGCVQFIRRCPRFIELLRSLL